MKNKKDIKEVVRSDDKKIGVGSVVLHLRKNRPQISNGGTDCINNNHNGSVSLDSRGVVASSGGHHDPEDIVSSGCDSGAEGTAGFGRINTLGSASNDNDDVASLERRAGGQRVLVAEGGEISGSPMGAAGATLTTFAIKRGGGKDRGGGKGTTANASRLGQKGGAFN